MTSVTGDQIDSSTLLSRRLSILPAILGLVAIAILVSAGRLVLPDEPEWPRTLVIVSVLALGVTVVSGYPVGLYTGLALFAVALVGGDLDEAAGSLAVAAVAMVVVHELIRVSLDARRATRFAPRFWTRFVARTVMLALLVVGLTAFARVVADASLPAWLVPAAIAATALPLLAHRLVGRWPSAFSLLLALVIAAVTTVSAVLGATARSQIESTSPTTTIPGAANGTTPTTVGPEFAEPSSVEPIAAIGLFLAMMLIVGAILIALRRREMTFDLDEIDMDLDETTLGFTGPGQADVDDDRIEIDEETIDRLLADLALDMSDEPDAGRAVRYAYANIERRLGELGVDRAESETEQEFLARAMPSLGGEAGAMIELTTLFERARFGHVPVSESMRERALDAVGRLRGATTPVADTVAGTTAVGDGEIGERP